MVLEIVDYSKYENEKYEIKYKEYLFPTPN
jgi:hypothetical protein